MSTFVRLKTIDEKIIYTPIDNILFIKSGSNTVVVFKETCEGVEKEQRMITPVKYILEGLEVINKKE